MTFDPDKALAKARSSVHAFGTDESSPHCDPCRDIIQDHNFIRLSNVSDDEVDELLKTNPYGE